MIAVTIFEGNTERVNLYTFLCTAIELGFKFDPKKRATHLAVALFNSNSIVNPQNPYHLMNPCGLLSLR